MVTIQQSSEEINSNGGFFDKKDILHPLKVVLN